MEVLMIACSKPAYRLMLSIKEKWIEKEPDDHISCRVKCSALSDISMSQSVSECVAQEFERVDAIVFFAAAGIAVRSIAPCLNHKSVDPAVIVMDETGAFCISLLSGHMGGANELTRKLADWSGAVPVITTATDREGKFSLDDYARKHELVVTDWKVAKELSAAVLEGERIGLFVEGACDAFEEDFLEDVPDTVSIYKMKQKAETCNQKENESNCIDALHEVVDSIVPEEQKGIQISYSQSFHGAFPLALQLVPKRFVLGIGCKKHTGEEKIARAVKQCLTEANIRKEAVCAVASIDLKKQEQGLLSYCQKERLPFLTYSVEELNALEGEYSESAFVEQTTGVSNVCERSAVAASKGELVCRKKIYDGVTLAIAKKNR